MENKQPQHPVPAQGNVNLNIDTTPAFYTDWINWNISPDGVVLNFGQSIMGMPQIKIYSRVGMGRELFKKFISETAKMVALTEAQGQVGKQQKS